MRFPLAPSAFALILCAPVWAAASEAPPAAPGNACGPFAESLLADTAAEGRTETAGPSRPPASLTVKVALEDPERAPLLEKAYQDAHDVLSRDEECSDFFGGREAAQHILGRLVEQLRDEPIPNPNVGIRMKGAYTNVHDLRTGAKYRLFDEATINRKGPFFRDRDGGREFADCGSFAANTRGARASMLLHELGHLIRGADGAWLLPNDAADPALVARNIGRIEQKCGRHIKALDGKPAPNGMGLPARGRG